MEYKSSLIGESGVKHNFYVVKEDENGREVIVKYKEMGEDEIVGLWITLMDIDKVNKVTILTEDFKKSGEKLLDELLKEKNLNFERLDIYELKVKVTIY